MTPKIKLDKLIPYQEHSVKTLKMDIENGADAEFEKMLQYEEEILDTLLAFRNIMFAERNEGLVDTSLDGCLELIRREIKWNELQKEELGTSRLRVLKAIEENLCALRIFSCRMAEQLAELPENTLPVKKTEVSNG